MKRALLLLLLLLSGCVVRITCWCDTSVITYLDSQQTTFSTSTYGQPTLPSNPTGSVMLAWINVYTSGTLPVVTPPAGWTLLDDSSTSPGTGNFSAAYYKNGYGGTGTITWSFSQFCTGEVVITSYDQIDSAAPIIAHSYRYNSTPTSNPSATAISTGSVTNAMIVGSFHETGDNYYFTSSEFDSERVSIAAGLTGGPPLFTPSVPQALLVVDKIQAASGTTGTKHATSTGYLGPKVGAARAFLIALKPAPNPSVPNVTYPNGGETVTVGASVTLTCSTATSPTVASSALQYDFDYSTNNGGSWTNIGLSAAGVPSKAWTVVNVPGATNRIRVRAYDGTLYSLAYDQSDSAFTIAAEVAPGAPTISSPSAGSVQVKSAALAIAWAHQGGSGNPQTAFTLQWSRDAFASHTATVGPTTTGTQSTTIDVSAEADGATISVKVKTQGVSLYSPYSAVRSFVISTAPATPNITAPTAGSPPTTPTPTVTFTEGSAFVARKFRVVRSSVEVYNSGEVSGSGLSFPSPFSFTNGQAVTIYLSVKNTYGLWSAEDSETVTPAYTGPAKPTAVYTVSSTAGNIQIQITNSDTPSYNEIWRYKSGANRSTAIRITPSLPVSGAYADYSVTSGVTYIYFVRAYNSSGLFTDSDDS